MGKELPTRPIKKLPKELTVITCTGCGATHNITRCPYCGRLHPLKFKPPN
jgi:rubrerythrin